MKIGFISGALPVHLHNVFGIHKRMDVFIEAIREMGELDMLFYVKPELNASQGFAAKMEDRLKEHWKAPLRLNLCNFAPGKQLTGLWQEYLKPAISIADHFPYSCTSQQEQISAVKRLLSRKPDILFVHRLSCMIPVLLSGAKVPPVYFDMDDIEHVAFTRSIKQPPLWYGKHLYYLRLPILRSWERKSIKLSRQVFVCSEKDRNYLSRMYEAENVLTVPNAVEVPPEHALPDNHTVLFLGFLSYGPNTVAADYLINQIWPIILSALPQSKLIIAGAHPDRIESFKERPVGVEFPGFIEDLEKLYREVRVVCCPILSGGGTRIKILEAAAHGKPVVSTTIGAEGIDLRDGKDIFLRDDPASFAEACIRLLKDDRLAEQMGRAARSVVVQQNCRDKVVKRIAAYFNYRGTMARSGQDGRRLQGPNRNGEVTTC